MVHDRLARSWVQKARDISEGIAFFEMVDVWSDGDPGHTNLGSRHSEAVRITAEQAQTMADWHAEMGRKYHRAAARPGEPIEADVMPDLPWFR